MLCLSYADIFLYFKLSVFKKNQESPFLFSKIIPFRPKSERMPVLHMPPGGAINHCNFCQIFTSAEHAAVNPFLVLLFEFN